MASLEQFLARVRVDDGDERFTRLFSGVVSRIPSDVQPVMSVRRVNLRRVGKLRGLAGLTRWSESSNPNDLWDGRGRQTITYYSSLLDRLSDEAYVAIVAHELAHAWLNEHVAPMESSEREKEADELVVSWGFGEELAQLNREAESIGGSVY